MRGSEIFSILRSDLHAQGLFHFHEKTGTQGFFPGLPSNTVAGSTGREG